MRNHLREKIVARIEAGERRCDVARAMSVHIQTVHRAMREFKKRGTIDYVRKKPRDKTLRTPELVKAVKRDLAQNPEKSIRKLHRDHNVSEPTMRRVVKKDLGLKSLAKTPAQYLTEEQKKRLEMGKMMVNKLRREAAGKTLVFSDEKDFHVDKHINRRNTRIIAESTKSLSPEQRYVGHSKFTRKVMLFGFVGADGKKFPPPVWVKTPMDAPQYRQMLIAKVFPKLNEAYGKGNSVWTQDGASCHTAKITLNYLKNRLGSSGYWSKGVWPQNSSKLNPLDYSIWDRVEKEAFNVAHNSRDSLKAAVEAAWEAMDEDYVRVTCSRFWRRMELMVEADGGIFKKTVIQLVQRQEGQFRHCQKALVEENSVILR